MRGRPKRCNGFAYRIQFDRFPSEGKYSVPGRPWVFLGGITNLTWVGDGSHGTRSTPSLSPNVGGPDRKMPVEFRVLAATMWGISKKHTDHLTFPQIPPLRFQLKLQQLASPLLQAARLLPRGTEESCKAPPSMFAANTQPPRSAICCGTFCKIPMTYISPLPA